MTGDLPVPHYATLARHPRSLSIALATSQKKMKHLVIDSTGWKLYGEGEWKVRTHGAEKRSTWRKLHIAMDVRTHQLTAASVTDRDLLDGNALPELVEPCAVRIEHVCADRAYDFEWCYRAIKKDEARAQIAPRSDAVIGGQSPFEQRDENVRVMKSKGRQEGQRESPYDKRSLVETAFLRLKTIFSEKLRARPLERQTTEANIRCRALNMVTKLGRPKSYAI
jgi:Transposase DDE domain